MGRSRYRIYDPRYPYFLTCTAVSWLPLFADPHAAEIVLESLRFMQRERELRLYAYVLMENHLHLVARSDRLDELMAQFKSYTARRMVDSWLARGRAGLLEQLGSAKAQHKADRDYQVWQEGLHPEGIQGADMMRQKADYVHQNPVKAGFCFEAEGYPYSSAVDYTGGMGRLPVTVLF